MTAVDVRISISERLRRVDRGAATRAGALALAVRVATPLALVLLFPDLRAFARDFTLADRALFFLAIVGALRGADILAGRGRSARARALAALALALNLANTALSLATLEPPVASAFAASRGGTAAVGCPAAPAILCAHPTLARLILAGGGTLYAAAVLTSSLYCLWRLRDVRQWMPAVEANPRGTHTMTISIATRVGEGL